MTEFALNSIALFASSYFTVLLLGFQSQIVRDKHVFPAFCTSIGIGSFQMFAFKLAPSANSIESFFFILGGACGIVSSIHAHNIFVHYFPHFGKHKISD